MASTCPATMPTPLVSSLRDTYKIIQQIANFMWIGEKDDELKIFYASIMAYCAILRDHIGRVCNNSAAAMDKQLVAELSRPTESLFTPHLFSLTPDDRLRGLSQAQESIRGIKDNAAKLEALQPYLDFGASSKQREGFVNSLATCEDALRTRYPEDPSQWAPEDFASAIKISEPSYVVWNAAQSIFKALVACKSCPCTPTHDFGARLCLGTYRRPDHEFDVNMSDNIDFDMFLSMKQDWHEVHINAAKKTTVQFTNNELEHCQTRTRGPKTSVMKVKRLCDPIARISTMSSYRLELKVSRDQLFKLRSERSKSLVDKSKTPVSLDQFLRDKTASFTGRTRAILAVILSSAVFHLYDTPWLQPKWDSSHVLFFRTASSAVPLRPFIQTRLSDPGIELHSPDMLDPDDIDPDDLDPDDLDPDDLLRHQCPTLVTLAVMLLEVYFVTPFDILAKRFNIHIGAELESSSCTRYMDVNVVFLACRNEIPDNSQFYLAVEHCLDPTIWEDDKGRKLNIQTLRTRIYEKVVLPLETELRQAYSSISIDDLDRFAQNLDFASWDQTINTWNQNADTESLQAVTPSVTNSGQVRGVSPRPTTVYDVQYSQPPQEQAEASNGGRIELGRTISEPIPRKRSRSPLPGAERFVRSFSEFEAEATLSDSSNPKNVREPSRLEYTVGFLCALPKELLAVRALFDTKYRSPGRLPGDSNNYALGTMSEHLVVAACLPAGEYGTNAAADSASNMKRSFPNIKFCLLVGIGGGVPSEENDIRLGDVVVSLPTTRFPGVIQYDRGKELEDSVFELTGSLQPPPRSLMTAISSLRSNPDLPSNPLQIYINDIVQRVPDSLKVKYKHPGQENDQLFKGMCAACHTYGYCGQQDSHIQSRSRRVSDHPEIYYGLIASGNRVIKDAHTRDKWAQEYGILCFEMEAAGVMNTFPCLVIRGICDYADSHKNKVWQEYAASTAAAYAKLLLSEVATSDDSWDALSLRQPRHPLEQETIEEAPSKRQRF